MATRRAKNGPQPIQTLLSQTGEGKTEKLRMKRGIGLFSGVCLVAGTMIGSGIFMTPQRLLGYMGSIGGSLTVWAAGGLVSVLGALCYAELGATIQESGGAYTYLLRNIGPLPAFLYIYLTVVLRQPSSMAAVSLSFAHYAVMPFYPGCPLPEITIKGTAIACVLCTVVINCLAVKLSTSVINIFTSAKLLALLTIVVGGMVVLAKEGNQNFQNAFQGTATSYGQIGIAFYQGLWAYSGWNAINEVTEELKRPEVNLPRALMIAVTLVTCLYIMVNISYFTVMNADELLASRAVAASWGSRVLGSWMWLIPLSVAMSTFGCMNGRFFSWGRLYYVAAREGHLPAIMSMIHVQRLTPSPALICTGISSIILIIPGNFSSIINYLSFIDFAVHGTTTASLLYMKIMKPDIPRPYKFCTILLTKDILQDTPEEFWEYKVYLDHRRNAPIIVPVLFLIICIYLVFAPVIDRPQIEFLYVVLFALSGVLIYIPMVHFKLHPKFLRKVTMHLQLLLEVAPTDRFQDDYKNICTSF